jgi:glutaredoxin
MTMEFVLYQQPSCPFCKHFQRLFHKYIPEGKVVIIPDHECSLWVDHNIDYVPTVIAYQDGKEVERLGATKLVGIRKDKWTEWLRMIKDKYNVDRTVPK